MLYETLSQPKIALLLFLSGFLCGLLFLFCKLLVRLAKNNKILKFVFEFITTLVVFAIFLFLVLVLDYGEIRLYHFILFFSPMPVFSKLLSLKKTKNHKKHTKSV